MSSRPYWTTAAHLSQPKNGAPSACFLSSNPEEVAADGAIIPTMPRPQKSLYLRCSIGRKKLSTSSP